MMSLTRRILEVAHTRFNKRVL
uniref:Uncharacterized protein n=1 Tax=Anguilla anguilla TaxID=7936 RepID=A0A0E9PYW6_ANGAN